MGVTSARARPDLLLRLAQGRGERIGVAGLDAPAREADLAGMVLQVIACAASAAPSALRPFDQRHQHCGPRQQAVGQHVGVEVVIAAAQARGGAAARRARTSVPAHAAGSLRPSGKNCSLLHTP